jgi:hypothetical protein
MRCLKGLLLTGLLVALPGVALAQRAPVLPVDEAPRNPEFFVFRARLQAALAKQDTTELLRILAPDVLNSLGGDGGREEFRRTWELAQPDRSQLWAALGVVLALGGRFQGDTAFYAPYTFEGTPGDGFETLAVLGRNVLVRAAPNSTSAVIDTLSFEAVTRWRETQTGSAAPPEWVPVRTSKARMGWVLGRYLRSPIDYRAGFVRRQGHWWLRTFVAGD